VVFRMTLHPLDCMLAMMRSVLRMKKSFARCPGIANRNIERLVVYAIGPVKAERALQSNSFAFTRHKSFVAVDRMRASNVFDARERCDGSILLRGVP
jgi:hypothetical protein